MLSHNPSNGLARKIALPAIFSALSIIFLYLASLLPTGRLGIVALAGLMPAGAVISSHFTSGLFCYCTTSVLGIFVIPDKNCVILYIVFFGIYSILKSLIERLHILAIEWVLKLFFFNSVLTLLVFALNKVLFPFLPPIILSRFSLIYFIGNLIFIVYDLGFSKIIAFYIDRINKAIRNL